MYFYADESSRDINLAVLHRLNPVTQYLKHYDNLLFLQFVLDHKGSDRVEKHQARKEVVICERKLKYWERQSDQKAMLAGVSELKAKWWSGGGL